MKQASYSTESIIQKLNKSSLYLDVLLCIDEFLEDNHIYAFTNWEEGSIIAGPVLDRHWITIALRYDHNLMPDPQASKRLSKAGCLVKYFKVKEDIINIDSEETTRLLQLSGKKIEQIKKTETVWVIMIRFPIIIFQHIIEKNLDYEDKNDETISDAREEGIDNIDIMKSGSENNNEDIDTEGIF